MFELQPITDAGRRFVDLAEQHAATFATRAAEHDRAGTFPKENVEELKASGFTTALIPEELGGLGLRSLHDLMVGLSRLARGDASTAIAVNMHLAVSWTGTRRWRAAREAGDEEAANLTEGFLRMIAGGNIALTNVTEAGTTAGWPLAELTPTDGGFLLDGTKIFSTLSPVADMFLVLCRIARPDGAGYDARFALVFRGSEGQTINDDWDALGMRASGSGSVRYERCFVPEAFVFEAGAWGGDDDVEAVVINAAGNAGLIASYVGVAEAAADVASTMVTTRRKAPSGRLIAERHGIQHAAAEMRVALTTARSVIAHAGRALDAVLTDRPVADVGLAEAHELLAEFQAAKLASNAACATAVDKAMQLSGGAGYMNGNPLGRHYRDVRAGPFMQVFSPNEAYEYIGKVTLGLPPTIET